MVPYPGRSLGCAACAEGGVQRGTPLWQGVPQNRQFPFLRGRGLGTHGAYPYSVWVCRAPEGGVQRGTQSLWQEVWRMCLHKPSSSRGAQPLWQEAAGYPQGASPTVLVAPPRGSPEWTYPRQESGVCRVNAFKGESRGAQPLWEAPLPRHRPRLLRCGSQ